MATLLLKNIAKLVTFDEERRQLDNCWLLIRDQVVDSFGLSGSEPTGSDQVIDLTGHIVLPGLINTHHHLFQTLFRGVPGVQNTGSMFDWLRRMYLLMSETTNEDLYLASLVGNAELLLSGCTTNVDHHYFMVKDIKFDTCIEAARESGIRFHLARGSFSRGESDGAIPPDHMVEKEEDYLVDCERLISTYHDPNPLSMIRIDLAPCSLYSVSPSLMKESIRLARQHGVRSHTHLVTAPDVEEYVINTFGKGSIRLMEDWGWLGEDVWFAHMQFITDEEIALLAKTGTGVTHCPNCNMLGSSGCCPVPKLIESGVPVSLGVDGSASNNASNMLHETRNALLMQHAFYGHDCISPTQILEIATLGGAKVLGRKDIGVINPGSAADLISIDLQKVFFAGSLHDPVAALVLCAPYQVDYAIVNGKTLVMKGNIVGMDLHEIIKRHNQSARAIVMRTEKRYGIDLSSLSWKKAFENV
jgi:cytosine/adenosine deaminase-related metal-dependent hydrolase